MTINTTVTAAKAWAPDVTTFAPSTVIPSALVMTTSTVSATVNGDDQMVRVAYAGMSEAQVVPEGQQIVEASPTLAEAVLATCKVAHLVPVSRELASQPGAQQQIADAVRSSITKKADELYLAAPVPKSPAIAPMPGLMNVAGIVDAGTVSGSLDALVDALATLETNGATPTHFILSPTAWASLQKVRASSGGAETLLGAGTDAPVRRLLGVDVLVSNALPAGTGLAVDKSAVISAVGPLQLAQSEHAAFAYDSIMYRATLRFGAVVVKPDRLAKFTVAQPGA